MTAAMVLTALTALAPADNPPRKANPLAPSLPLLTKEEAGRYEKVLDRFILYETGKLGSGEKAKVLAEFNALGPDATFQLLDALNRAAQIESSCPAVIIARKLAMIFRGSNDVELLQFARENIGAGVTARRHLNALKDLRLTCMLRQSELQRQNLVAGFRPGEKGPGQMTISELANAAGSERGPRLRSVLVELERRQGEQVLNALGAAAASYDSSEQQLARGLLVRHLSGKGAAVVRDALKADQPEVRAAAARVVASRRLPYTAEVIELLNDGESVVRQAARQALVQLSRGRDFGPEATAGPTERAQAVRQWQDWLSQQGQR
jgi:hypothetical protein